MSKKCLKPWLKSVSKKVREARERVKLTQEELAERTGLPLSFIHRLEAEQVSPSFIARARIALITGVPMSSFFATEVEEVEE